MRYFTLFEKVDVSSFQQEIVAGYHLFTGTRARQVDFHRYTKSIALRTPGIFPGKEFGNILYFHVYPDRITSLYSEVKPHFPTLVDFLENFAKKQKSILGRVQIVMLLPHKNVLDHVDYGLYYALHKRYHLVVSSKRSGMHVKSESVFFQTGDLFSFENRLIHGATNDEESERVHVIFDLLPQNFIVLIGRYIMWIVYYSRFTQFSIFKHHRHVVTIAPLLEAFKIVYESYGYKIKS